MRNLLHKTMMLCTSGAPLGHRMADDSLHVCLTDDLPSLVDEIREPGMCEPGRQATNFWSGHCECCLHLCDLRS